MTHEKPHPILSRRDLLATETLGDEALKKATGLNSKLASTQASPTSACER